MKVKVVFGDGVKMRGPITTMLSEDVLFATKPEANISLRAFGAMIDRVEVENNEQIVYIKSIDNLILG